jgi:tetratricopeptide (TPR) repeat protein
LLKQCNDQMNVKGQFQLAAEFAEKALDLSQKAGDKIRASTAMVYLGAALAYQGRLAEALEVSQKNLALAREIGDQKTLEQALNTVGGVLGESGRYEESLSYFHECLDVARQIGDATMQYMSLLNIGEAYVRSGDPDKAEAPLQESLRIARGLRSSETTNNPSKKGREMALLNLAAMEAARQHYRVALNYYEQVHASQPESPLWVISALEGMAEAHERLGEPRRAIDLLRDAMPLSEKAASGLQYARLLSRLGVNQELLGQLADALASQNRALALVHGAGGNPDHEWQIE